MKQIFILSILSVWLQGQGHTQGIVKLQTLWSIEHLPNARFVSYSRQNESSAFPLYSLGASYTWKDAKKRYRHQLALVGLTYRQVEQGVSANVLGSGALYQRFLDMALSYEYFIPLVKFEGTALGLAPAIGSKWLYDKKKPYSSALFPQSQFATSFQLGLLPELRHEWRQYAFELSVPVQVLTFELLSTKTLNPILTREQQRYKSTEFMFLGQSVMPRLGFGVKLR